MNDRKLTNLLKKFIMRGYSAKAVALAACLALLATSVNITAFAVAGDITSTPNVEETLTEEIREEPAEETRKKTREEDPEEAPEETGEESREETGEETSGENQGEPQGEAQTESQGEPQGEAQTESQGEPQGEAQTESQEEPQGEDISTSEETAEETMVAFDQSVTVDGVVITVTADEGVFPEGATVEAVKVTSGEENEVTEAIDEVRDEEKKVAASYTFDISIYDKEGKEIEPDTEKGSVKVTFKMEEIANENLETDVYHVEKTDDGLNVEGLYVDTEEGEEDEAAVETTAFSFYTVEFTYDELQYVLEGGKRVELSTVLDAVGIKENGEISGVEGSNDELFRPVFDEEETAWYIEAVKAFDTEQWLKVTISEIEYVIVVTDSQSDIITVDDWSSLKEALDDNDNCTIKLGSDMKYSGGEGTANILECNKNSSTITLDLNGHVLDGNNSGSVVTIKNGATLTLVDSNPTASHTGGSYGNLPVGGVITGGSNGHGAGILIQGGKLIMNAGTISGNYANNSGSGVCVGDSSNIYYSNPSEFIMNGGSITGNGNQSTQWGGGVCVGSGNKSNSTFTMNGGTISNNTSQDGGGVHVGGSGTSNTFNMTGGTISGNNSTGGGGGVSVYLYGNQTNYCFKMTGGTITDNTASGNGAGVNLRTGGGTGQLTIGGTAKITENTVGGVTNNLYLPEGKTISVGTGDAAPQSGMSVGITTATAPTESNPVKISTDTGADYSRYFVSDDSAYTVKTDGNVLKLMIKVAEPDPTPAPKPDPQPEPSPDEPEPQPTVQPLPKTQYAETGMPVKNYLANNPTGSKIPLPYITTDAAKAGWQTIGEALDAHKAKYKNKAVEPLSITTNGYATVDTKLIIDAHEKKIPLLFVLDDEVTVGIPVANTVLSDRAKEGKTTYFKISAMTTAEAVSIKKMHAGLLPSDIAAIGGNENTPVVLTLCSNDKPSTGKSQLITITFNAKKAGFKKGDKVYIYCGTSLTGISMYKMAKVDKNGFVTFRVPMGGNYWTIGNKNMKNKLLRNG